MEVGDVACMMNTKVMQVQDSKLQTCRSYSTVSNIYK